MLRPTAAREYMSWQSCSFFWSCQSLLRWSDESAHGVHDRSEQLKASRSLIRQKCQRLRSWGLSSRERSNLHPLFFCNLQRLSAREAYQSHGQMNYVYRGQVTLSTAGENSPDVFVCDRRTNAC